MKLQLVNLDMPGDRMPFEAAMDLRDIDIAFSHPFQEPVRVYGEIQNTADVLLFRAEAETVLHLGCARCAESFTREYTFEIEAVLAQSREDEENDEIYLLEGDEVDLDEIVIPSIILDMDQQYYCKDDCKGLCQTCGANLNHGPCSCQKDEIDPRLSALRQWMDQNAK